MIILAIVASTYLFGSSKNPSTTISDNYGQYDQGSAMCEKGAHTVMQVTYVSDA